MNANPTDDFAVVELDGQQLLAPDDVGKECVADDE
jgi:hypothetical protein